MDSTESHLLSSANRKPSRRRLSNASGSDASIPPSATYSRLRSAKRSPGLQRSSDSGSLPELAAPIPLRYAELQALDFQANNWPTSSSPASSRAISPSSPLRRSSNLYGIYRPSISSVFEQDGDVRDDVDASAAKRWIRWMHRAGMKGWVLPSIVLAGALVRWCIGLGSYSGYATPPMFGDYEAQRHWMEITIHLPVTQWYRYDLQYWGLDYPPFTAYVSWLCGKVGSLIEPSWFEMDSSRGMETPGSKLFMRTTVLFLDSLIYVPALFLFTRVGLAGRSKRAQNFALITLLFQPALLLIDFGHFQYNSVMLGFTVLAVSCFLMGRDALGAFFFVCSICFKQMALYFVPAIGMYLLGKCLYLGSSEGAKLLARLSMVTSLSFTLFFLPFLPPFAPLSTILDPVTRIFPFNRGIFEDKVANFWCASNVIFKWRVWASRDTLVRLSALFTPVGFLAAAIAPVKAWLRLRNSTTGITKTVPAAVMQPVLLQALLNSSLSFFLFSFQVHEKTILLPLLPLTLLLVGAPPDSTTFDLGALCNNIAVFSMWPLLKRDGLAVQYIALLLLWNRLIGYNPLRRPLAMVVYSACIACHMAELVLPPPARYPDIYSVLNVLISTPVFGLTWLWSIKSIIEARWAVGGLNTSKDPASPKHDDLSPQNLVAQDEQGEFPTTRLEGIARERGIRAASLGFASGRTRKRVISRASAAG